MDTNTSLSLDSELQLKIANIKASIKREESYLATIVFLFFLGVSLGVAFFYGRHMLGGTRIEHIIPDLPMLGYFSLMYWLFSSGFLYVYRLNRIARLKQDCEEAIAKREIMAGHTLGIKGENCELSHFDRLVLINLTNLEAYYGIVKHHAGNSFLVAILSGCIGFLFIIVGITYGLFKGESGDVIAYVSTGSGVITEFISCIFFYLYNKTVRQLKGYHDSLLAVQNVLLSFRIVETTKDEGQRNSMMTHMIERLVSPMK